MKLLIVEDEAKLADYLRKGLAEEGYVVEVAGNGIDGLHLATEGSHDLIVLDAMLPGIDGLGLLAALRQSKQTPVIMLTARHRVEDRVRGLKAGADDYLVKPFAFSELVARIEVLLRRASGVAPAPDALVLTLGELELDMARRQLLDPSGVPMPLALRSAWASASMISCVRVPRFARYSPHRLVRPGTVSCATSAFSA